MNELKLKTQYNPYSENKNTAQNKHNAYLKAGFQLKKIINKNEIVRRIYER